MSRSRERVTVTRLTAQCAVEAVGNNRPDYDDDVVATVLADGVAAGVSDLYLDLLR